MSLGKKAKLYKKCMVEAKKRIEVVESVLNGVTKTPYIITNAELILIQVRKIIELIALSAVVANEEEYKKVKSNLEKLWNAKAIIKELDVINPRYYPKPIVLQCWNGDPNNTRTQPIESGFLKREELLNIYANCGGLLHAENPFGKEKRFHKFLSDAPKLMLKITALLDKHVVNLLGDNNMIMVLMNLGYEKEVQIGVYHKAQ